MYEIDCEIPTNSIIISGDEPASDEVGVLVLSSSQYCRFRAVKKRLDGCQDKWLRNSLVVALGGFATRTRLFSFSYLITQLLQSTVILSDNI